MTNATDGVFDLQLGSGKPLPIPSMDKPLWLSVAVNGASPSGRHHLDAVPYAVSSGTLASDYVSSITVNGRKLTDRGTRLNIETKGIDATFDEASSSLILTATGSSSGKGSKVQVYDGGIPLSDFDYWGEQGNHAPWKSTHPFAGTTDTTTYELRVDNLTAFRSIATGGVPTLIGGAPSNWFSGITLLQGSFIGGGAGNLIGGIYNAIAGGHSNTVDLLIDDAAIGGGSGNRVGGPGGVIAGGYGNHAGSATHDTVPVVGGGARNSAYEDFTAILGGHDNFSGSTGSNIGGGEFNYVGRDDVDSEASMYATVSGGSHNTILHYYSTIGGGKYNSIGKGPGHTNVSGGVTISGGDSNTIRGGLTDFSSIGGGYKNWIDHHAATIAGGDSNTALANHAFIGGGRRNRIDTVSNYTTIAGGDTNSIRMAASHASIAGGFANVIDSGAQNSAIGGGRWNVIQGPSSVIAGGDSNLVWSPWADHNVIGGGFANVELNPSFGTIGGGWNNTLDTAAWGATIGGGWQNIAGNPMTTVAGGWRNRVLQTSTYPYGSAIGGGRFNTIKNGDYNAIAGGDSNTILAGHSVISGGMHNTIRDTMSTIGGGYLNSVASKYGTVSGGEKNSISNSEHGTIAGGDTNELSKNADWSTIGGGRRNVISDKPAIYNARYSTIGGGDSNFVEASYATISGGRLNHISPFATAATIVGGEQLHLAKPWQSAVGHFNNDSTSGLFTVGNGASEAARSNAFIVTSSGHSVVYGSNGNTHGSGGKIPDYGGTYQDNTIVAWADVNKDGMIAASFGVKKINHPMGLMVTPGTYVVYLGAQDANGDSVQFSNASITVSLRNNDTIGYQGSVLHPGYHQMDPTLVINEAKLDPTGCGKIDATQIGIFLPPNNNVFVVHTYEGAGDSSGCTLQDRPFFLKVCARP